MTTNKESGLAQITAVGSVATAAGIIALALRKRGEISNEVLAHLDEETLQLLVALAAAVEAIKKAVENLQIGVQGFPPNCRTFVTFQIPCPAAGVPVQLPNFEIPEGFELVVKNHPGNAAGTLIYVAKSMPDAQNINTGWPLVIQESLGLAIKNSESIWVSSNAANQAVCCVVEQR